MTDKKINRVTAVCEVVFFIICITLIFELICASIITVAIQKFDTDIIGWINNYESLTVNLKFVTRCSFLNGHLISHLIMYLLVLWFQIKNPIIPKYIFAKSEKERIRVMEKYEKKFNAKRLFLEIAMLFGITVFVIVNSERIQSYVVLKVWGYDINTLRDAVWTMID